MSRRAFFWVLVLLLLALDQGVKMWARAAADGIEGRTFVPLLPGVFELTLTFNRGIAFGLFQGAGILLAPIALGIAAGAAWYSWRHPSDPLWGHAAAALLASGALGNLYDRIILGKVTDMFHITAINFPVFNVADACISVAAGMLILSWIKDALKPESPAPETSPAPAE